MIWSSGILKLGDAPNYIAAVSLAAFPYLMPFLLCLMQWLKQIAMVIQLIA